MKELTPEVKKDILTQLYNLMRASGNTAFDFISQLIEDEGEAKTKLVTILNIFYMYYKKFDYAFINDAVFFILDSYYELLSDYIKLDEKGKLHEPDTLKTNELVQRLINLPANTPLAMNSDILDGVYSQFTEVEKQMDAYREEADKIKTSVQEEVKKLGLARFSGTFYQIVKQEHWAKILWLCAAFLSACGAAYYILTSYLAIIANDFNIPLIVFLEKITDTLLFCFAAYWCSKRYYICRTQEIIYRHTAVALKTYAAFIKATDKEDRGVVAAEMAHTLFSPPLLPSMKMVDNSDWTKIIEILRLALDREGMPRPNNRSSQAEGGPQQRVR